METLGRADDSDDAGPFAVITETAPGKLILKRAQNSGKLTVTATMSNGCKPVTQSVTIAVTEPKSDAWVARKSAKDENPEDGQFYARDDKGGHTLFQWIADRARRLRLSQSHCRRQALQNRDRQASRG